MSEQSASHNWRLVETAFQPERQHHQETIFTIGNGYLGARGTFEEGYPGDQAATLIAGLFDEVPVVFTELANTPNWMDMALFVDGERFRLDRGRLLAYTRALDLHNGLLTRQMRWQSPAGKTVEIVTERFASLADEHILGVRFRVTPLDFSGRLEFRSGLRGQAENQGWVHWQWLDQGSLEPQRAYLHLRTKVTKIELAESFQIRLEGAPATYDYWDSDWSPVLIARAEAVQGQAVSVEKLVSVYTSRETEDVRGASAAGLDAAARQGYAALLGANDRAWRDEWEACNITIEGDDAADLGLRFNLYQLLIAAPRHDERVSIAAKALTGFGYRGHVFWDTEIFILPFFIFTRPQIARNLLLYRYATLEGARRKAAQGGFQGAQYAWESADTGDETTPRWIPLRGQTDLVRIWTGDIEPHISADIAYAIDLYWRATGDDDFMVAYGAEMLLDTAKFWGSRAEWHPDSHNYQIRDVIGPDEYHDHVHNNAYTNNLVRWHLRKALEVLEWLWAHAPERAGELEARLDLSPERLAHWREVIVGLVTGFDPQTGLFEQFEGFFKLKEADLTTFEPRTISMQALLGIEGVQDYQIIKQPDVLMLLYLLGNEYSQAIRRANWDYYTPRTDLSYGSSLGPAIQSALAAQMGDLPAAYRFFLDAARTDLEDTRGNTNDGIHAATAGGLWQAAVLGFGGLVIGGAGPAVVPRLPPVWAGLRFKIYYRGRPYEFDLTPGLAPLVPVRLAIFDLDGVLTDTSELHYQAWKQVADAEGLPFNREDNEALRGVSRRESLIRLLKGRALPEEKMQALMERKNELYLQAVENLTSSDLLPGAARLLEEIRRAGVKTAVASSSRNARRVIDKLGLGDQVDVLVDGNDVKQQKPAPDLFLLAAHRAEVPPGECVVFEDAESGIQAARAAGMWSIGIGPAARVGDANLVIPSFKDAHWEALVSRLAERQAGIGGEGGERKGEENRQKVGTARPENGPV